MQNEVTYGAASVIREFKLEAVKLVMERDMSTTQVARDLGLHADVVSRWVRESEKPSVVQADRFVRTEE